MRSEFERQTTSGFSLDEPLDQFVQLLYLVPMLSLDHRERHLAEFARVGHARLFARLTEQRGRIEELVEPLRRVAKQSKFLLQIDVDPAEKERCAFAAAGIIKHQWQIHRHHKRIMAEPPQRLDERMIAQDTCRRKNFPCRQLDEQNASRYKRPAQAAFDINGNHRGGQSHPHRAASNA